MARIIRGTTPEGLKAQAYMYFMEADAYSPYVPMYTEIFDVQKTTKAWEQGTSVIGSGLLEETAEGVDAPIMSVTEGFTTYGPIKSFKKRIVATRESQDDHQRFEDVVRRIATEWGAGWKETKDEYAVKLYLRGGYTAGDAVFNASVAGLGFSDPTGLLIYDSKPWFNLSNNTRANKAGTTYYNAAALALNIANFQTTWDLMTVTNAKRENDQDVPIEPTHIMHGSGSLEWTSRTMLESTLLPGTANNDINPLQGIVDLFVWRKMTDTDFYDLLVAKKGKIFYDRMEPEITYFQNDRNFDKEVAIMARIGHMITNWRYDCVNNASTS